MSNSLGAGAEHKGIGVELKRNNRDAVLASGSRCSQMNSKYEK
jgi:hypothetical protein